MKSPWLAAAAALLLGACPALADPQTDLERQAAMAKRFDPFDANKGPEWENALPTPLFRRVAEGASDPVDLPLKRGAYMIVVLCNCDAMDVTLLTPDGTALPPLKSNQQSAMYSLDAPADGDYLVGVDMTECGEDPCDLAIKPYRKRKDAPAG